MPPISQQRLEWIEARLFILARTVQTLRREGARTATRYFTDTPHDAQVICGRVMQDLQSERLALMMEREAITDYMNEEMRGMQNGS